MSDPVVQDKPFLKASEVARLFGVSHSTVFRWVKAGRLRAKRTLGGNFRFDRREIQRLWEQQTGRQGDEHRRESRFRVNMSTTVNVRWNGRSFLYNARITNVSDRGIGLVVYDDNRWFHNLLSQQIRTLELMNDGATVLKETFTGAVRHFTRLDALKTEVGVELLRP